VCKFCGITFARKKILTRHTNKEHVINYGGDQKCTESNYDSDSNSSDNHNNTNNNTSNNMVVDGSSVMSENDDRKKISEINKTDEINDGNKDNTKHTENRFSIEFLVK